MGRKPRTISVVRGLASRQHGVFSRTQLVALGLSPALVEHWLRKERIEVVHRSVYTFSRELLTNEGCWMAAVLAAGAGAVLSHQSAAALWRIRPPHGGPMHVTTTRKLTARARISLHCLPLAPDEVMSDKGIPTTTPARTLLDIAHGLRPHELEKALRDAEYLRLNHGASLATLAERHRGRAGIRAIRRLLEAGCSEAPTRSELEVRFATFIQRHDLPLAERNALIDLGHRRVEVDFLWRSARLVVELDGYSAHGTRHAFEDDRERDRQLQLAGFIVIRVTWRQLHADPLSLARDLRSFMRS